MIDRSFPTTKNETSMLLQPFTLCQGRHSCRIPQTVLYYKEDESLCPLQKHANFIRIRFTCVTGIHLYMVFRFVYNVPVEHKQLASTFEMQQ